MLKVLRAATCVCREKVGWNRIGLLLSITVIVIAGVVLYRILHDIEIQDVVDAVRATDWHRIALAGLFVAAGYFTLTFYDLFALRTIGRSDVPYRVAALAGFTSYSIGHNVGASVFTGGAVRYRIYSYRGLTAVDVAKICFVAGLTFWLGNATVLGLGISFAPQAASAIDQLPPWCNRAFAIVILAVLVAYVIWVWQAPRQIGRSNWQVTLPNGPLTLLQIGIGIVDLACCAFAMFILMPDEPHIGFVTLAVIFVSATLLGFASHAPGGIGVFDATMLIALWQFDREDVLAGLLLFRLIYYVVPFALALVILGLRELLVNLAAGARNAAASGVPPPAHEPVPHAAESVTVMLEREREARATRSAPASAPAGERDNSRSRQRQSGP
jgi:glycosyltransferase 2 family protein